MPAPHSNDLRKKLVKAVDVDGMSRHEAADYYEVSVSAVINLMQRFYKTASHEPKPMGGYKGHKLSPHRDKVEALLQKQPDITLAEMTAHLADQGIKTSKSGVDRFLNYLKLSYKKNSACRRTGSR